MEEKIFTIPLRKAYRASRNKRAKKAISIIREFLKRHMKNEEIVLGESINQAVWSRGAQKPPRRIRVHAILHEGRVYAELLGIKFSFMKKSEEKKKEKEEKEKAREEQKPEEAGDKREEKEEK